jgi:hypothetical protein
MARASLQFLPRTKSATIRILRGVTRMNLCLAIASMKTPHSDKPE